MNIINIPQKMQKFYGVGTMLHPDEAMVTDLLSKIPPGKIMTLDRLCKQMAVDHKTDVTCPMRTLNLVKSIIARKCDHESTIPFWRVVSKDHYLINSPFMAICVDHLKDEGFEIKQDRKGKLKLMNIAEKCHYPDEF